MRSFVVAMMAYIVLSPAEAAEKPPTTRQAVATLLKDAKASHTDAMLVTRDGKPIAEFYSAHGRDPIELMSVTKSFVALAVGLLIHEGKITSLDTPVHVYLPEWKQGEKQRITLRMLLNHTSGLQNTPDTSVEIYPAPDAVKLAVAAELDAEPGTVFAYNNKAVNLLASIVGKVAGIAIDRYLQERLFEPMSIRAGKWDTDSAGNPYGMSGLPLRAIDLAKIGQLLLDQGRWEGRELLSANFVQEMLAAQSLCVDCGLLWWRQPTWTRMRITERSIATMRDAGVSPSYIQGFAGLVGREFTDPVAFFDSLGTGDAADGRQRWTQEVVARGLNLAKVCDMTQGPVIYRSDGYLGQYLVIVPQVRVIAIRQIAYSESLLEADSYEEFMNDVIALAATFDKSLGGPALQ